MSRSGLEIDRDTGNIIREGCGSCIVKIWHETNSFTGAGYYSSPERTGCSKKGKAKRKINK